MKQVPDGATQVLATILQQTGYVEYPIMYNILYGVDMQKTTHDHVAMWVFEQTSMKRLAPLSLHPVGRILFR